MEIVNNAIDIIRPDIVIFLGADFYNKRSELINKIKYGYVCTTYHSSGNMVWKRKYKNLEYKTPKEVLENQIEEYLKNKRS